MIVKNEALQCVGCTICGEVKELSFRKVQNPEFMLILLDELAADHRDCEQWKHDPRLAKLQRALKLRVRREQARAERRKAAAEGRMSPHGRIAWLV